VTASLAERLCKGLLSEKALHNFPGGFRSKDRIQSRAKKSRAVIGPSPSSSPLQGEGIQRSGKNKDPGSLFGPWPERIGFALNDKKEGTKPKKAGGDVARFHLESRNPHLPAASRPAASPVKITGEVSEAAAAGHHDTKKEPGFFPFGCAQGFGWWKRSDSDAL
jgi:hypothetical protein